MENINDLKEDFIPDDRIIVIESQIHKWFSDFLALYKTHDVTPYIHAFRCHVPEFLRKYNNINFLFLWAPILY